MEPKGMGQAALENTARKCPFLPEWHAEGSGRVGQASLWVKDKVLAAHTLSLEPAGECEEPEEAGAVAGRAAQFILPLNWGAPTGMLMGLGFPL